jgi:hypothetical protein
MGGVVNLTVGSAIEAAEVRECDDVDGRWPVAINLGE